MAIETSRIETPPPLLHRGFVGVGAGLLIAALGTDYVYYSTSLWQWSNFSAWLITAGLIVTLVAAVFLVVDFATGRAARLNTMPFLLVLTAAVLSVINAFVHSRDAWTSVVPLGMSLSLFCALLLILAGTRGWRLALVPSSADHR